MAEKWEPSTENIYFSINYLGKDYTLQTNIGRCLFASLTKPSDRQQVLSRMPRAWNHAAVTTYQGRLGIFAI